MFRKRHGTTAKGTDYEDVTTAKLSFHLVNKEQVKNFRLFSNHKDFDCFDDIVLTAEYKNNVRQYAFQLKHCDSKKVITKDKLAGSTGNFSIQKYKESYKKIKNNNTLENNFHCILFTCAKFQSSPDFTFHLKNKEHIKITASEYKTKNTSTLHVYVFNVEDEGGNQDDEIQEYKEFFKHFFLYANQKNLDEMKQDLSKTFQDKYHCEEAHFENYNKYIKDWSVDQNEKKCLDKKQVQLKIGEILLKPFLINSSILKDPRFQTFKKASVLFDVVIVNTNEDNVKNMFFKDNTINLEKEKILFVKITQDNEQMVYEGIRTIHNSGTKKTFVLVGDNIRREDFSNFKILENLFDLRQHSHIYESIVQDNKISLQGREPIALETLLDNDEEMEKIFTTSELLQILSGNFRIGEEKENLPVPYIDQVLIKFVIIDISFLRNTSNLSVISCENNLETLKKLVPGINFVTVGDYLLEKEQENISPSQINYDRRVVVAEDKCTVEDFDMIREKNILRSCHHFRLTNKNLEWIASKGNVTELINYLTKPKLVKESEIFNSCNRINVISAEAGMGKSVMLKFMKNRYPSCSWVLDISLRTHFSFFEKTQDPQEICRRIFHHHCEANGYNRFEEKVAKKFVNKKQIVILLDGLDEIVDFKVICKVIAEARALSECGFVVWISARTNVDTVLINELCIFPLIIAQMDKEQQMTYAKERLKSKYGANKTKKIVEKIINFLNTTKSSAILGVVLQIKILTDLLIYNPNKYSQFMDNNFTLTDMIGYFIEETINFNHNNKSSSTSNTPLDNKIFNGYRQNKIIQYENFSIEYFLHQEDFDSLLRAKLLNKSDEFEDEFGIITYVKDTKLSYFFHNIYGEYLAASWFVKNFKAIPDLANIFFRQCYTNIRKMFDIMLSKNCPAHLAILHNNFDELSKYEKELEMRDDQGRNPLHLACSYGQVHPPLLVTKSEDKYIIDFQKGNSVQEENSVFVNILNFLIERCNPSERDRLFNWDCLNYALNTQSLFCVNSILVRTSVSHEIIQNMYDDATLVFYSVKFNYINLFEFIENLPYFESKDESHLLHQISQWDKRSEFLVTILKNKKYHRVINKTNYLKRLMITEPKGKPLQTYYFEVEHVYNDELVTHYLVMKETPIHIASVFGNFEAVKILIENGANVNVLNNNGSNPLHYAASRGRLDIVRLLVKSGAVLNVNDVRRQNELHFAFMGNTNKEMIKFLLETGSRISLDRYESSVLRVAVQKNQLDIIQLLHKMENFESPAVFETSSFEAIFQAYIDNNTQILNYFLKCDKIEDLCDSKGNTILHHIVHNLHVQPLKRLLQKGINVNRRNQVGHSPLHCAALLGNLEVLKLLLNSGAEIGLEDNQGATPLVIALKSRQFAAAKFLMQNIDGFNLSDPLWLLLNEIDKLHATFKSLKFFPIKFDVSIPINPLDRILINDSSFPISIIVI